MKIIDLNAKSEIGAELDSLADVVSFGVAPGFILFQLINLSKSHSIDFMDGFTIIPFIAFIVPAFAALRLAKFNVDEEQTDSFLGLPTPALAIFIASLPLMTIINTYFLLSVAIIGSLLMVSRLPMFALKFNGFGWKNNKVKYTFIGISIILILFFKIIAIPVIILFYLFLSLIITIADFRE